MPSPRRYLQGSDGWLQYLVTLAVMGATVATTLLSSYSSRAASRAAEDSLSQLEEQVRNEPTLLTTSLPNTDASPAIADCALPGVARDGDAADHRQRAARGDV